MKKVLLLSALASIAMTSQADAQLRPARQSPADQWATGWVGGLLDPGVVRDFESGTDWTFGSGVSFGAGVHKQVGGSLLLGLDASYSPARFERRSIETGELVDDGSASIGTALVTARLRSGGVGGLGMYLTGGAGAFIYGMPDPVSRWDFDPAFMTGAGVEYRPSERRALFVEWGRFWTFHQREGVRDNTTRHSQVRIGVRTGW